MSKRGRGKAKQFPRWIVVGVIIPVLVALIPIVASALKSIAPPPATPTPACISGEDVFVRFHVLRNGGEIAVLSPTESLPVEPGTSFVFQVEAMPVSDHPLPPLDCVWVNTGIATDGQLLHKAGCKVDYQSGEKRIMDTLSMQLSQPSCAAFAPQSFFIVPKQ
jgi:hypothetical protein